MRNKIRAFPANQRSPFAFHANFIINTLSFTSFLVIPANTKIAVAKINYISSSEMTNIIV